MLTWPQVIPESDSIESNTSKDDNRLPFTGTITEIGKDLDRFDKMQLMMLYLVITFCLKVGIYKESSKYQKNFLNLSNNNIVDKYLYGYYSNCQYSIIFDL